MNISGNKNICVNNITGKQHIGKLDVKTLTISNIDILNEILTIQETLR